MKLIISFYTIWAAHGGMLQSSAPSGDVCLKSRQQCNILLENFNKCHITSHKTRYPHNKLRPVTTFLNTALIASLSYHECLSACWWWGPSHCAQEEVSVYGRSHSLSDSGVRTLSDQSPRRLSSISDPDPWVPGVLRVNPPPSISASCGAESVRTFYRDHYNVTRE